MVSISERPTGITILAVLYAIQGLYAIAIGGIIFSTLGGFLEDFVGDIFETLGFVCLGVSVVIGIIYFLIAWGLWTLKTWARILAIIFAVIGLFMFPVGTIISIILLWYLFKPEIKAAFN